MQSKISPISRFGLAQVSAHEDSVAVNEVTSDAQFIMVSVTSVC